MKTKIYLIIVFALFVNTKVNAQFEINNSGMVQITANTQDWQSGLKVTLPTENSCAYHLTWNGSDRIYQVAKGYIAAEKGFFTFSDIKLKENIVTIDNALFKVKKLRGVYFNYKPEPLPLGDSITIIENDLSRQMGVIAQEVEAIIPEVVRNQHTGYKAVAYQHLIALLIEAVKEQQNKIDTQSIQIQQLKQEITDLKGKTVYTDVDKTKLYQNDPNPFKGFTTITYFIDEKVTIVNAEIEIRNMMGILQTTVPLGDRSGLGKVQFDGSGLSEGYYVYSLKLNGSLKDSKMLLVGE